MATLDTTIRYCAGMAGMAVLGTVALVMNNDTSAVIAVAVGSGIGFLSGHYGQDSPAPVTGA
jgi:hypothetical protein